MNHTSSVNGFAVLLAMLVITVMLVLLLNRRTRRFGLFSLGALAVLAAFGMLFVRSVDHPASPSPTIVEAYSPGQSDLWQISAQRSARQASEVLKNQRLAARMDDAVHQYSQDGTHLETYPDGMQIRQSPDQTRTVLPQGSAWEILSNQRLTSALPDAFVQRSSDGSVLETYPDGMQVRQSNDLSRTILPPTTRAEILANQRLAGALDDAVTQYSPDGARLETYPDGMQIRQAQDQTRVILRAADHDRQSFVHNSPSRDFGGGQYRSRISIGVWALFLPIMAVLALLAVRGSRRNGAGAGWGAAAFGLLALLLLGSLLLGYSWTSMRMTPSPPMAVSEMIVATPAMPAPPTMPAPPAIQIGSPESIEQMWNRLTRPRIRLENSPLLPANTAQADTEQTDANRDLAEAAKLILSATAPAADPFTQGWLTSAAKTILKRAEIKAAENHSTRTVSTTAEVGDDLFGDDPASETTIGPGGADPADEVALPPLDSELLVKLEQAQAASPAAESPRPEWLTKSPGLVVGNIRRYHVSAGPYVSLEECRRPLEQEIRRVVADRIAEVAGQPIVDGHAAVPPLEAMGLNTSLAIREFCVEPPYIEQTVSPSVGLMQTAHVLLEFAPSDDAMLLEAWRSHARRDGIKVMLTLAGLAVSGLGLVFGLLKLDTWTRGYYTKRLFLGVTAAIIAAVALVGLLM